MKIKVRIPVKVMANGDWISRAESGGDDDNSLEELMQEWDHEQPLAIYWIEADLELPVYSVDSESVTVSRAQRPIAEHVNRPG